MPQIKLKPAVNPNPKTCTILAAPPPDPVIRGVGDTDLICAGCDRVMVQGMGNNVHSLVLRCDACGTFSSVP